MTREEAIQRARAIADAEGWRWEEPVEATSRQRWVFWGPVEWEIVTNVGMRGCNVRIAIDSTTGDVIRKHFCPR
jgi:hypothetical protein